MMTLNEQREAAAKLNTAINAGTALGAIDNLRESAGLDRTGEHGAGRRAGGDCRGYQGSRAMRTSMSNSWTTTAC